MPIYEYECVDCSEKFEVRRGFNDEVAANCPVCQGEGKRMFSPVTVIYKGSGFYTTDYGRGNSGPRKRDNGAETESKPTETKETKKEAPKVETKADSSKASTDSKTESK
ncbi:FmdB family zinc ribbon protein [Chloroflexota bacterium]